MAEELTTGQQTAKVLFQHAELEARLQDLTAEAKQCLSRLGNREEATSCVDVISCMVSRRLGSGS